MNDIHVLRSYSTNNSPAQQREIESQAVISRLTVLQPHTTQHTQQKGLLDQNFRGSMMISDEIFYEDDQVLIHGQVLDVKRIFVRKISPEDAIEIVIGKPFFDEFDIIRCIIIRLRFYNMTKIDVNP
jgi:hypothetical protein